MPSGHVGNYPMPYAHGYHYGPSGGPIELLAPLLLLGFLCTLAMAGQWLWRRIQARRLRLSSASAARLAGTATTSPVLASEPERDRTTDRLCEAIGEGRLSFEEGGQRIDAALKSRYRHELELLVADLPALVSTLPLPMRHAARRRGLVAAAVVVVLAALVVQLAVGLWALWPLAVALVTVLGFRRLVG